MENVQTFELLVYPLIIKYKQMIISRLKLQKKKKKIYKICERRKGNIFARLENVENVEQLQN